MDGRTDTLFKGQAGAGATRERHMQTQIKVVGTV